MLSYYVMPKQASYKNHQQSNNITNGLQIFYLPVYNECLLNNGGCEHICVDTEKSYYCACNPGYTNINTPHTCSGKYCYCITEC